MLTYGGGSIKKMGLFDTIMSLLKDCKVVELNGIAPNPRFAHSAKAVWGLEGNDDTVLAKQSITAFEKFLTSLNLPLTLTKAGITEETNFEAMAEKAMYDGLEYAWIPLTKEDVVEIYKMSL